MATLEEQLGELDQQREEILARIDERNSDRRIGCASCEGYHRIGDLEAIQTHFYVSPHGCMDGDYWNEGELQFICPEDGVINRLLFNNNDVPWDQRELYENDPEKQFKHNYRHLFKSVEQSRQERPPGDWTNNYYVDRNREEFGLVERRTDY